MSIFRFPPIVWLGIGILIISLGIRQSFGIFMTPISDHFLTGREFFSLAIALQNLLFGAFQPFIGMVADRWGARRTVILGALSYGLGLALTALSSSKLGVQLSFSVLIGLGLSATSYVIILGAIAKAVPAQHSAKAFGLTTAAGSFGMFAVIPGAQQLLANFGWQDTLLIFALCCSLMIAFAAFIKEPKPTSPATTANESEIEASLKDALLCAFNHRGYWLIHLGFFVCGFHVMFIATHLPSYVSDSNLDSSVAALALAYIGIFNIAGSFFWGLLADRYNKRYIMCLLYVLRAVIIALFVVTPITQITASLFGAAIGFVWLGTVPLTSGLVRQIFGAQYMSTLYGLVFFSHQLGSFLGAWCGGLVYDYYGAYEPIWWCTVGLALIAAVVHLPINDAPVKLCTKVSHSNAS